MKRRKHSRTYKVVQTYERNNLIRRLRGAYELFKEIKFPEARLAIFLIDRILYRLAAEPETARRAAWRAACINDKKLPEPLGMGEYQKDNEIPNPELNDFVEKF